MNESASQIVCCEIVPDIFPVDVVSTKGLLALFRCEHNSTYFYVSLVGFVDAEEQQPIKTNNNHIINK